MSTKLSDNTSVSAGMVPFLPQLTANEPIPGTQRTTLFSYRTFSRHQKVPGAAICTHSDICLDYGNGRCYAQDYASTSQTESWIGSSRRNQSDRHARYYTLYFLESFNSARCEHTNMLLREYEAGRLRVPVPLDVRKRMYGELQTAILRQPPFTNTPALLATHHCIYLLVTYIRHTMAPEGEPDDSWITSLLTLSPFERIVEFFSAEIGDGGSQRVQRKEFMYNFYADTKHAREHLNSVLFGQSSEQNMHSSVQDLWFDVARAELESRNAIPHEMEKVWSWGGIPLLFGCPDCHHGAGWRA
ncbi:hypothetical protein N7495_008596 [Penicillium taxi]|uniref:uncharacterized protein n=1 Tax=Penicillium taxi TaxID=168475 RepID=UPI0025455D07|nr:uncharacterized protein N7495_008596 [Penicillium taxi]KAJ5888555.1 hypothetical protein N7495_008596 [Penicillium taxi]